MTTLAQAEADLIAAPRPVLFVDTCTLLDIVRAPLRDLTLAVRAGASARGHASFPGRPARSMSPGGASDAGFPAFLRDSGNWGYAGCRAAFVGAAAPFPGGGNKASASSTGTSRKCSVTSQPSLNR